MNDEKNPMTHMHLGTYTRMLKYNPTEAEAYRKRVTGEDTLPKPASTYWAWETGEEKKEDKKEEKPDQKMEEKKVINLEEVRKSLKDKGVKSTHLMKNEGKIIALAIEHGIL